MQVILLERIASLGQIGQIVRVRPGYARNYLLPRKKALRATKENRAYFEQNRVQIETVNLQKLKDATYIQDKLNRLELTLIRQGSESGVLYGSVRLRDIIVALSDQGFQVSSQQIRLIQAIKTVGLFEVPIVLHPDVIATITLNIARSQEEAEQQAAAHSAPAEDPPIEEDSLASVKEESLSSSEEASTEEEGLALAEEEALMEEETLAPVEDPLVEDTLLPNATQEINSE